MDDRYLLKFSKPATCLTEACLVGNGSLGAVVYGGVASDTVSFNTDTLWSGCGKDKNNLSGKYHIEEIRKEVLSGNLLSAHSNLQKYVYGGEGESYMPLADLSITVEKSDESGYSRILDMKQGLVSSNCGKENKTEKEYFCSAPDGVFCAKFVFCEKTDIALDLVSKLPYKRDFSDGTAWLCGYAPCESNNLTNTFGGPRYDKEKKTTCFCCGLRAETDGSVDNDNGVIRITSAESLVLYFAADTDFYGAERLDNPKTLLSAASKKGYCALRERHVADFSTLIGTTDIELSGCDNSGTAEEEITAYSKGNSNAAAVMKSFRFGRYLLASCSRFGTLPATLQGLWSDSVTPPWCCAYTTNINLQMNYWATEQVGLSECLEPYFTFVKRLAENGKTTAKESFGSGGWCAGHNSDCYADSAPVGHKGAAATNPYSLFMGCAGWLCLPFFEHYEYTGDKDFLQNEAYPLMKGAARFYLDNLKETPLGLAVVPGSSPENKYYKRFKTYSVCAGSAMETAIVAELFQNTVKAAEILGVDEVFSGMLSDAIKKLAPLCIGSKGQLLEWDKEYRETDVHHRHISHLYCNHPGHLVNRETPELAAAVARSLDLRGDGGTGWSLAWKINQWARLGDGNRAEKLLRMFFNPCSSGARVSVHKGGVYLNYLCAHPPFQIDGNFGVMSGVAEMLLQSTTDEISLLPALPASWKSGSVTDMAARGNYVVSFSWENGKPTRVLVKGGEGSVKLRFGQEWKTVPTNLETAW